MTTDTGTNGNEGERSSGFAAFFSTTVLLLLGSGGIGTVAFLLLMRSGHTVWGLVAGFGWTVAAVCLIVLILGAYVAVKNTLTIRRLDKKKTIYK
jgi:hypothetical protein